ncbi:MAG: hypothetical protein U9Q06_00275 [Nanoarchaeota archaeon]|nr:hypothetical protein [Nanoarchaeota archaeon]
MKNKKADMPLEEVTFIILNLVFFGILIFFVVNGSSGAFVMEQFYAKQIGTVLNGARPGTVIKIDVSDACELAEKNNVQLENVFWSDNYFHVKLSGSKNYRFPLFNDVDVDESLEINNGKVNLVLTVK